ncbi:MAG: hypothetical protein JWQ94_2735 [Tardiphaga sp.]|jgi:hypothetical protein|nr:hypothetical protein [Tardiphaga sp.]
MMLIFMWRIFRVWFIPMEVSDPLGVRFLSRLERVTRGRRSIGGAKGLTRIAAQNA